MKFVSSCETAKVNLGIKDLVLHPDQEWKLVVDEDPEEGEDDDEDYFKAYAELYKESPLNTTTPTPITNTTHNTANHKHTHKRNTSKPHQPTESHNKHTHTTEPGGLIEVMKAMNKNAIAAGKTINKGKKAPKTKSKPAPKPKVNPLRNFLKSNSSLPRKGD